MILYHGSDGPVCHPVACRTRPFADFGRGFYCSLDRDQAAKYCDIHKRRGGPGIVSRHRLDEAVLQHGDVLHFKDFSQVWLVFVLGCWDGRNSADCDVVIGPAVDDAVFNVLELFQSRLIRQGEALSRLQAVQPIIQVCIRNQAVLDGSLYYEGSEVV